MGGVDDMGSDYINHPNPGSLRCYIMGNDIWDAESAITQVFDLVEPRFVQWAGDFLITEECPILASCLEGLGKPGGGTWDTLASSSQACPSWVDGRNCWCKKGAANCLYTF